MRYCKVADVKSPVRGTERSAGIDFFVPSYTEEFETKFKAKNPSILIDKDYGISLLPHERVNIPSGIKAEVPTGFALIAYNKSGVSLKYGLDVGASVVDEDYQGEIHISLVNTSDTEVKIAFGQKIVQFILVPIFYDDLTECPEELCFTRNSERKSGGFGSTGSK